MGRFILQKKSEYQFILTDTKNKISCQFEFGKYNETQKFTLPEDINLNEQQLATIMSEFGDYMAQNHYFIAMPYNEDACRVVVAKIIENCLRDNKISVYQLSKLSGVQEINIHRILQGKYSARIDTIIKLLNAMGKSMSII